VLEPENNPTPGYLVDPPAWIRLLMSRRVLAPQADRSRRDRLRRRAEARRRRRGEPHTVEYFHQLDDPYAHLTAQLLAAFTARYDVELRVHLIRATGGNSQPEPDKLAVLARRDTALIAPHYGLSFPAQADTVPAVAHQALAVKALLHPQRRILDTIAAVSEALWSGDEETLRRQADGGPTPGEIDAALDQGSTRLAKLKHYSGATFFYGGEWYWGVDRLDHLERRLRDLSACREPGGPLLAPRPQVDVTGVDARGLRLDFYPSLNSPYTSIVFDRTIALKDACGIEFHHKPVLPMVMRGVPATRSKAKYIVFDTAREAETVGVPFGNLIMPIGTPTRRAYSMLPWARAKGRDEALMSELLRHAFALGVGLHRDTGMRQAVEAAGLDWTEAQMVLDSDDWKPLVEQYQEEMVNGLGLWGVPSFKLSGPDGQPDLALWGQDRLWVIAAEIRRRAAL